MFRKHKSHRRGPNILFVTFRLFLSLIIFGVLAFGALEAYKQFSGSDPLKLSPKALISNFSSAEKLTEYISGIISTVNKSNKLPPEFLGEDSENFKPVVQTEMNIEENIPKPKPKSVVSFKFAITADSHNENELLAKALIQAKEEKAQFVIGLGDYTEVGTLDELEKTKSEFDKAGLRYFVTAGDHDLWDSRDKNQEPTLNFNKLFGPAFQSFSFGNAKFIILYNSDNYLGLGSQFEWLNSEFTKENPDINVSFALLHEPLYHPSSTRVMGKVTPGLKDEAKKLTQILKTNGVKEVFSGDIHYFTRYTEPESGLQMTTIGALTAIRNTQEPRFAIITVFEDGSYEVEDVEVK